MSDWRKWSAESFIAAATLASALLSGYVARNVAAVSDKAAINQRLAILELEVASAKGWEAAHDARTMPLIAEHQQMAREWPRALALIEEIHLFLVRRFQMPTRVPLTREQEPSGGLYAAEPPGANP